MKKTSNIELGKETILTPLLRKRGQPVLYSIFRGKSWYSGTQE